MPAPHLQILGQVGNDIGPADMALLESLQDGTDAPAGRESPRVRGVRAQGQGQVGMEESSASFGKADLLFAEVGNVSERREIFGGGEALQHIL